jgi:hypothetical protein
MEYDQKTSFIVEYTRSSLLAYLFLALIYNRMRSVDEHVSLISAKDILNSVRIQYILSGKDVTKKIDSVSLEVRKIAEQLKLVLVAWASQDIFSRKQMKLSLVS